VFTVNFADLGGSFRDSKEDLNRRYEYYYGDPLDDESLTTLYGGGRINVSFVPSGEQIKVFNGTNNFTANDDNTGGSDMSEVTDTWTNFLTNNNTGENGVGYSGAGFNPTFGQYNADRGGNVLMPTQQTAYSPTNTGAVNSSVTQTSQTAYSPYSMGQTGFAPTSNPYTPQNQTQFNPYAPNAALAGLQQAPTQAMPSASPTSNANLTALASTPTAGVYNTQPTQNAMDAYFSGQQTLPQLQALMDEMERKQGLETSMQEEQMTNRGLGNSTFMDQARADLGSRQRNELMNLATQATMQLLPMQVGLSEQMRQGDMAQRSQQVQELFGALGLQDQLGGSQFGRELATRQQGFNELMGAMGLEEQLEQGEFGRNAAIAQLRENLMQGQFGREATQAQLLDQFKQSQFGRDLSSTQLQDALKQSQFGRQLQQTQLNDQLRQSGFAREAAAAQLQDALTQSQFDRQRAGYGQQFDEFARMADLYNQNRQIDYNQRLGGFNAFSQALGRLSPAAVNPGQAPGPEPWESGLNALLTYLGGK